MSEAVRTAERPSPDHSPLVKLLMAMPPGDRGAKLQSAIRSQCDGGDVTHDVSGLRKAFAEEWQIRYHREAPLAEFGNALKSPVPIGTVMAFCRLHHVRDADEMSYAISDLAGILENRRTRLSAPTQLLLVDELEDEPPTSHCRLPVGKSINQLDTLVTEGQRFGTIYADPPWAYENEASRAAAVDHYPVMSVEAICDEPVRELADDDSHLHLWTTNSFLPDAFRVVDAWGFRFKSCLVWIKHELGMGNYWRVSHEFLLLGVRGKLTFRDRTLPSWIQAHRTIHSRKPGIVRTLIEKVSPGPYLELYGREELPNSAWTVYGNQIEKRFF